jgi:hypothetical protein
MQFRATTSEPEKALNSRPHLRVQSDRRKRAPNIWVRKLCVQVGLSFANFNDNLRVEGGAMFVHLPKMRALVIGHTIDRSHQSEHCTSLFIHGLPSIRMRITSPVPTTQSDDLATTCVSAWRYVGLLKIAYERTLPSQEAERVMMTSARFDTEMPLLLTTAQTSSTHP